jgi:hypothetical protein
VSPDVGDGRAKSFENEAVGIIPDPYCVLCVMNDHFFIAVGEKALYFWRFVNFDVSQKNLVFQVPDLKLFGSVCNEQM